MQLEHLKCRGEDRRREIIQEYDIEIIRHERLLNGRTKESDAGDIITTAYYEFLCTSKKSGQKKIIVCGTGVGPSLIKLANLEPIPLFNPLIGQKNTNNSQRSGEKKVTKENMEVWNIVTLELYYSVNIISIFWNRRLNGVLLDIKKELEKYYYKEPRLSRIKAVNTCISRGKFTIQEMLNKLRENNRIKEYKFDNLNSILKENSIKSYF